MADSDDTVDSFLALVDEAFRRLLDEPDAYLHVTGFAPAACAEPQSLVKAMTAASWMVVRINSTGRSECRPYGILPPHEATARAGGDRSVRGGRVR